MKVQFVLALVCAAVIGVASSVACGGAPPGPTSPSAGDAGAITNGTASERVPHEGHEH